MKVDLPPGVSMYRQTPEFDQDSVPRGLLNNHSTKSGVWGVIRVLSGSLRYVVEDEAGHETVLSAGDAALIEPQRVHHVAPVGQVRFFVEFYR